MQVMTQLFHAHMICSCYGNWRAAAYYADLLYDKSRWSKVKHLLWKVLVSGHCSCGMYVNIRFVCAKRDTIIKHSIEQVCCYLPFMFYHWNVLLVFCYCVLSLDSKTSVGSTLLTYFPNKFLYSYFIHTPLLLFYPLSTGPTLYLPPLKGYAKLCRESFFGGY